MARARISTVPDEPLLTSAAAGRVLELTPATVRYLERTGRLPAIHAVGGVRLFRESDVLRCKAARERARQERAAVQVGR